MPSAAVTPGLFDDLVVFLAVVNASSVAGASRALGLDPSTVSRRIKRLEEALDFSLFHRGPRGMEPSELGLRLARRVQNALNEVSIGIEESTRTADELEGAVRVTAPTEIGTAFVIPVLYEFQRAHPRVQLELEVGAHVVDLEQRHADIAVRTHRTTSGDVITRQLGTRPVRPFHARSLAADEARVRWMAWIEQDPLVDAMVERHAGARIVFRSNDLAGLRAACVAGLGTAVLPELLAASYDLVPLAGVDPIVGPPLWIAAPTVSLDLPRVRALWDHLLTTFAELPGGSPTNPRGG